MCTEVFAIGTTDHGSTTCMAYKTRATDNFTYRVYMQTSLILSYITSKADRTRA